MSNFGQRIKKARLEAGLSQEALADAISRLFDRKKISRTAVTQWESNKTNGIEASNLLKATKVLNVTPDWLQFGCGSMRPTDNSGSVSDVRFIPLLNTVQAANHREKYKEITSQVGIDEALAKIISPYSFALIINDNSMASIFKLTDLVIIDPTIKPYPGEFVAAKLKNESSVVFRKYQPISYPLLNKFELVSLSEDWKNIIVSEKNSEIIGTLVEHRCKRRMCSPAK